jgi:dipeptidase E
MGVSAGSLLLGPSIELADWFTDENHTIGLDDFQGVDLIPYTIFPHYSDEFETKLREFEVKYNTNVIRLNNNQALIIEGGNDYKIIE